MSDESRGNRWRYYVDKSFQNRFIYGFSAVILLTAIVSLGVLWVVRENPYSLLPDKAAVLVNINASRGIVVSQKTTVKKKKKNSRKKKVTYVENAKGTAYFPVQVLDGKLAKYNAFDVYWYPIVFISLLNIFLVSIFSLFFSHRMAGPVYRIKSFLKGYISTGEAKYLNFRKSDHFKDLAVLLNQAFKLVEIEDAGHNNTSNPKSKEINKKSEESSPFLEETKI